MSPPRTRNPGAQPPADPAPQKAHAHRTRRALSGVAVAAAALAVIPAVAEGVQGPDGAIAQTEKALVSKIHLPTFIEHHSAHEAAKETSSDATAPPLRPADLQAKARAEAAAKAKAEAAQQEAKARAAAQDADEADAAPQDTATTAVRSANAGTEPPASDRYTFHVVMGSGDRASLQTQVFTSTEPVDATAFYGTPWIIWDRTKGGLTFPQNAGAVVHLTGAITGTYRVDGLIEYINANTPINEIKRGTSLTFQVCDPIEGHNRMHIVGLTRVS